MDARDRTGRFFSIIDGPGYNTETSGLAFSPDAKFMVCFDAYQRDLPNVELPNAALFVLFSKPTVRFFSAPWSDLAILAHRRASVRWWRTRH